MQMPINDEKTERQASQVRVGLPKVAEPKEWYKPANVTAVKAQQVEDSNFSPEGKEKLARILEKSLSTILKLVARILGIKFVLILSGGVHPSTHQYPLNSEALEMDMTVKELLALAVF